MQVQVDQPIPQRRHARPGYKVAVGLSPIESEPLFELAAIRLRLTKRYEA